MVSSSTNTCPNDEALFAEIHQCLRQGTPLAENEGIMRHAAGMRRLMLYRVNLTPKRMEEIVTIFSSLTTLGLNDCDLEDDSCRKLKQLPLVELDLSNNRKLEGGFVYHLPKSITRLTLINVKIPVRMFNELWTMLPNLQLSS